MKIFGFGPEILEEKPPEPTAEQRAECEQENLNRQRRDAHFNDQMRIALPLGRPLRYLGVYMVVIRICDRKTPPVTLLTPGGIYPQTRWEIRTDCCVLPLVESVWCEYFADGRFQVKKFDGEMVKLLAKSVGKEITD